MIKFSVIMPVYNVENYLERSIENIINQKYDNWELYLVNDGSTDSSGNICKLYAKTHEKIHFIHQENAGSGRARQNALDLATGDYICFVDPDDFLDTNALLENSSILEDNEVDILVNGFYKIKTNLLKKQKIYKIEPKITGFFDRNAFIENFSEFNEFSPRTLWNKLYKKQFLIENNIMFTDQRVGQDALFNYQVYRFVRTMIINDKAYYNYDTTRDGSAVKKYRSERFDYEINLSRAFKDTIDTFSKENIYYQEKLLSLWSAIIVELKNINFKNSNLSFNEKIMRIKTICRYHEFEEMFSNLDPSNISSPISRLCFLLLKNHKIKITQVIINIYVKIMNY